MATIKLNSEIHPHSVQADLAATMPSSDLLSSVLEYNWGMYPADVLSVIASRDDCSLLTALEIFCRAEPAYYEQRDNQGDPAILAMLHDIHDRVNKGTYVHNPQDHLSDIALTHIKDFLTPREAEHSKNLNVLWQFDPNIVLPALTVPKEIGAELKRRALAPTDSERSTAEGYAIDIYTKSSSAKSANMCVVMANRPIQNHVAKLLDHPARIKALITERKSKPDILKLPSKSHALAIRLSQVSNVETEQDLMRRFNPSFDASAVADWQNFGAQFWHAGFEIEDMMQEFGEHPAFILSNYLTRLTEKYAPPGDYYDRYTYFIRETKGSSNTVLDKVLGRKQEEDGLWARYVFVDTMMFVGLSDYLTGTAEQAANIEKAAPISDELKQIRKNYQQSVKTLKKRVRVAKKFRAEINRFLDKDVDAAAWENRPRWSQYRQVSSLS